MNKDNLIKDILNISKKYDIRLFSILRLPNGNIGVLDTIQDHQVYENILIQLYEQFYAVTFPGNSSELSEDDIKSIPIEFLIGCMDATMKHLDNLQSNSELNKYNQFSKGVVDGLSDDEINRFIDIKMKEGTIPIQYFNFNELEDFKGRGRVHIACTNLPILCDLCDYFKLDKFHIASLCGGYKDLATPNDISFDDVKEFLQSNVRYNIFKLGTLDKELIRKLHNCYPYPEINER